VQSTNSSISTGSGTKYVRIVTGRVTSRQSSTTTLSLFSHTVSNISCTTLMDSSQTSLLLRLNGVKIRLRYWRWVSQVTLTSENAGATTFLYFLHSSPSDAIMLLPKNLRDEYWCTGFGKRKRDEETSCKANVHLKWGMCMRCKP